MPLRVHQGCIRFRSSPFLAALLVSGRWTDAEPGAGVSGRRVLRVIASAAGAGAGDGTQANHLGRERLLREALEPVLAGYDQVVIDTRPNLGLLSVNGLVCADRVVALVSAEDEGALYGVLELKGTIAKLTERLGASQPRLFAVLTRWVPRRISSQTVEEGAQAGLSVGLVDRIVGKGSQPQLAPLMLDQSAASAAFPTWRFWSWIRSG